MQRREVSFVRKKLTGFSGEDAAQVSLDDWEKQWQKNPQQILHLKVLLVDFRSQPIVPAVPDRETALAIAQSN